MPDEKTQPGQQRTATKKQWLLFITGLLIMLTGLGILGFFGGRKIYREIQKYKLIKENMAVEISDLHIKAPVLEGTEQEILSKAAGHFPETGAPGHGNFCIAAHSSILYKEYFNNLKHAEPGMQIILYDKEKNSYCYQITETRIVEPSEIWILDDFGDDRITLVTCTDDGSQRLVVTGMLDQEQLQQIQER
ncbi:MAG: class D sortase [Oscillospiraceae bacterium]|nr:class D sortase [Oscillospiraceae bacterium]